ncbi:AAA family ATPase [Streptomyces hydrogenans]|uniref:ParA family protein n=1 Tax=Streptomyces hydrogenans TaxID=1873719 RepID=UPI00167EFDDD
MARRVAFVNNKCGVGKSTTTVRLAEALAKEGKRVLVVDMDPQGNASSMLGWVWDPSQQQPTISHAIQAVTEGAARTVIQPIAWDAPYAERIALAPATLDLESRMSEAGVSGAWRRLDMALKGVDDTYDSTLIDCQPSVFHLTQMALAAAHDVVIVTEATSTPSRPPANLRVCHPARPPGPRQPDPRRARRGRQRAHDHRAPGRTARLDPPDFRGPRMGAGHQVAHHPRRGQHRHAAAHRHPNHRAPSHVRAAGPVVPQGGACVGVRLNVPSQVRVNVPGLWHAARAAPGPPIGGVRRIWLSSKEDSGEFHAQLRTCRALLMAACSRDGGPAGA